MTKAQKESPFEKKQSTRTPSSITSWIGSPASLIIHTVFFFVMILWGFLGENSQEALLILTTIVSLEAIYLSIFIQMTVNRHADELGEVSDDIEEIQEDVGEIQEDVGEIQKDVDDIQEDVEDITDPASAPKKNEPEHSRFTQIELTLKKLVEEISELKNQK